MAADIYSIFLAGIICLGTAVYVWQRERIAGAVSFALLMIDAALFAFPYALQTVSPRLDQAVLWHQLTLPATLLFPPIALLFTLQYTRQQRWLKKPYPQILFLIALIFLALCSTNPIHGLFESHYRLETSVGLFALKSDAGPIYWLFQIYAGSLIAVSLALLIRTALPAMRRWRIAALAVGVLALIVGCLLLLLPQTPFSLKTLTPWSFAFAGILCSVALFHTQPINRWLTGNLQSNPLMPEMPENHPAQNHLEAILNALPDLLLEVDWLGCIYDYRTPRQQHFDLQPEPFIGKLIDDMLPPDAAQVIHSAIQQAAQQGWHRGATYSIELDNRTAWFEISIKAVSQAASQAAGDRNQPDTHFIILIRDVSDRLEIQEKLGQSEERFHNLIRQSRDGIVITDEQGTIIEWNQRMEQMIGISAPDALGKPFWDIQYTLIDQEQRTPVTYQMIVDWVTAFLSTGELPFENKIVEQQYCLANGTSRTIQTVYFSITSAKGYLLCGFIRDITDRKEIEKKLRRQNEYLEALYDTTLDLISHLDLNALLENIVRRAGNSMGTTHGFLDLVNPIKDELEPKIAVGILDETSVYRSPRGVGLAGKVWQEAQPIAVNNYDTWDGRMPQFAQNKVSAMVGIPLLSRARVIGVLGLAYPAGSRRIFELEDVHFLEQFARLAAVAIDNARLFTATNELLEHEQHLKEVAQLLSSSLDLSKTLDTFMHLTVQLVDADAGLLGVFTPDGQDLHYPYRYNLPANLSLPRISLNTDGKWETGGLDKNNNQSLGQLPVEIQREWSEAGIQNFILLPVSAGQEKIGILWLFTLANNKHFSERQLSLAQAAAQQAALAIQNARRFKSEQTRGLRQTALFRLSKRLASASEESDIWQQIPEGLQDPALNYTYIVLLELDPITGERVIRGHVGWTNEWLGRRLVPGEGLSERPLRDGKPHYTADITQEPNYFHGLGRGSEADIPIWIERELVGVLTIEDEHSHAFSSEDMEVFISAANQAGLALGQARLLKRTQKHVNEMRALNIISQKLHAQLDINTVIKFVGEQIMEIFNVQGTYISIYDEETNMLHFPFWNLPYDVKRIPPIHAVGGLTKKIFETRRTLLINQDYDQRFIELGGKKVSGPDTPNPKSWMGTPILSNNQPVGVLCIQNYQREQAFTDDEVTLLEALAANLGVAIQNVRLYSQVQQELQERQRAEAGLREANHNLNEQLDENRMLQDQLHEQVIRDPLTGLFNRRYLREALPSEVARAQREGYSIGIMIMDLDHFKTINDTYGHDAGDAVLEHLGHLLYKGMRASDIVCRYGGEEIVIVLPRATQEDTLHRAENIRTLFEIHSTQYQGTMINVQVSIGVAAFPRDGASGEEILIKADRALYQAKQNGRNQVQGYESQVIE